MKLLFITRKFSPMVGGMENLSFSLAKEFSKNNDTTVVSWGKSQRWLPFFYLLALVKALYLIPTKKIDHVHLGDALMSPLGLLLKTIFRVKTTTTVCGLDITYKLAPYQFLIPRTVKSLDKVICISQATLEECVRRGIPKEKCTVIPCGVYPEKFNINASRDDLEILVGKKLERKKVLITVGRLVERKGVNWFLKNVFPKLDQDYVYLIIGDGPDKEKISQTILDLNLSERVFLLGRISDEDLKVIYNTADLFVMPNIPVPGNIEGFGIVAIEASSTGLPVVAADFEGIRSAVMEGKTGYLALPKNSDDYIRKVNKVSQLDRDEVKKTTISNYSWQSLGNKYIQIIN